MIGFIDILYALAIGTGFTNFPKNPIENPLGTSVFIYTLLIAFHDWFEYHDKLPLINEERRYLYYIIQIFVILSLNQMFAHSIDTPLIGWLIYAGIFCLLNVIWNVITPFEKNLLYAATSGFLFVSAFLIVTFYQPIISLFPGYFGDWTILGLALLLTLATVIAERLID